MTTTSSWSGKSARLAAQAEGEDHAEVRVGPPVPAVRADPGVGPGAGAPALAQPVERRDLLAQHGGPEAREVGREEAQPVARVAVAVPVRVEAPAADARRAEEVLLRQLLDAATRAPVEHRTEQVRGPRGVPHRASGLVDQRPLHDGAQQVLARGERRGRAAPDAELRPLEPRRHPQQVLDGDGALALVVDRHVRQVRQRRGRQVDVDEAREDAGDALRHRVQLGEAVRSVVAAEPRALGGPRVHDDERVHAGGAQPPLPAPAGPEVVDHGAGT